VETYKLALLSFHRSFNFCKNRPVLLRLTETNKCLRATRTIMFNHWSGKKIKQVVKVIWKRPHCHRTWTVFPILYNGPPLLRKIVLSRGGSGPHLIPGSLGQPESTSQTAPRSVQPLLRGWRRWQTDRRRYSVCNNRPHLRSTAMSPSNRKLNVSSIAISTSSFKSLSVFMKSCT